MQTGRYNLSGMPPGRITSPRSPPIPPKTQEDEHIYHELGMPTALKNLRSDAAQAEEGELCVVYELTLPNVNSKHFN